MQELQLDTALDSFGWQVREGPPAQQIQETAETDAVLISQCRRQSKSECVDAIPEGDGDNENSSKDDWKEGLEPRKMSTLEIVEVGTAVFIQANAALGLRCQLERAAGQWSNPTTPDASFSWALRLAGMNWRTFTSR